MRPTRDCCRFLLSAILSRTHFTDVCQIADRLIRSINETLVSASGQAVQITISIDITLRRTYRAKIGFDLQKGFNIEVQHGRFLKPGQILLQLPRAEVQSVEPLELQKTNVSGWINWVTNRDMEVAVRELGELTQNKAAKLEMLEDAERRIENRLNQALLTRVGSYNFTHRVKFLETVHFETDKPLELPHNIK